MNRMRHALSWLLLALASSLAASEIYTWTDENGVTHFTDQRPAGQSHAVIEEEALEPVVIDNPRRAEPPPAAPPSADRVARAAAASRAGRQREQAAERVGRQCQGYRERLEQIQSRLRAGYGAAEGNRLRRERRALRSRLHNDC